MRIFLLLVSQFIFLLKYGTSLRLHPIKEDNGASPLLVCGSDFRTYSLNKFKVAQKVDSRLVAIGKGPCKEMCTKNDPVCGSNGQTYTNRCHLGLVMILRPNLSLFHSGKCLETIPSIQDLIQGMMMKISKYPSLTDIAAKKSTLEINPNLNMADRNADKLEKVMSNDSGYERDDEGDQIPDRRYTNGRRKYYVKVADSDKRLKVDKEFANLDEIKNDPIVNKEVKQVLSNVETKISGILSNIFG